MPEIVFTAEVIEWRGPAPYYFFAVVPPQSDQLKALSPTVSYGWGMVPVTARIAEVEWTTSLWPKDGRYLLPLKTKARSAVGLELGDRATITMLVGGDEGDRDTLIGLVNRIRAGEAASEEQEEAWLAEFARSVPHPRAIDLVLFSEVEFGDDVTPDQIVDAALGYQPR